MDISPVIVGDAAFPLRTWLMKPYPDAVVSPEQKYFNYRLSRARIVTESADSNRGCVWPTKRKVEGPVRKNECDRDMVSLVTLACMILHDICIEQGDSLSRKLDLTFNPDTLEKRNRDEIRDLLKMTGCQKLKDTGYLGKKVRNALLSKSVVTE